MAIEKITFNNKSHVLPYGTREIQIWDKDINEIKAVVNANADLLTGLEGGYQGVLLIADTPLYDGYYMAGESGTFTNAGGLVVDLNNGITFINVSDTQTVFTQTVMPIDYIPQGEIAEGETLAVSGGKIFDSLVFRGWATIQSNPPINFNFDTLELEVSATVWFVVYDGIEYAFLAPMNIDIDSVSGANSTVLLFDIEAYTFRTINTSDLTISSTERIIAIYRKDSKAVVCQSAYTIDGVNVASDGTTRVLLYDDDLENPLNSTDIFYRGSRPIIDDNGVTFPSDCKLYYYDFFNNIKKDYQLPSEQTIAFTHNTAIVWNIDTNIIESVIYPANKTENQIVLFRNVDDKLVSGKLKRQYDNEEVYSYILPEITDNRFTSMFYYRNISPIIEGGKIIFPQSCRIYYVKNDNSYSDYQFSIDTEYTFEHNSIIVFNIATNVISHKEYNDVLSYDEKILFKNIDSELVSGELMAQYNAENINTKIDIITEKGITKILKDNTVTSTYASDMCTVNDEIWAFAVSNDDHTDTALCQRYSVATDFTLTKVGEFSHNLGHCNSIAYNEVTDCLITGNGSGDYDLLGEFYVLPNASSFTGVSSITLDDNAIIYDLSTLDWGAKSNVIWGEDNGGRNDIAYVLTNDNVNIRKIQLGKGVNDLGLGTLIGGTATDEFNGTFKLVSLFSQEVSDDVIQGSMYDTDGKLKVGMGHNAIWYNEIYLQGNGTFKKERVKQRLYDELGVEISVTQQGITRHDGTLFVIYTDGGVKISAITG